MANTATSVYGSPPSSSAVRNTELMVHTAETILPGMRWAAFNQTPLLQTLMYHAFGTKADAMKGNSAFGNKASARKSSGKGFVFHKGGGYQVEVPVHDQVATGRHVGIMGTVNPSYYTGSFTPYYNFYRLIWTSYVPEEIIQDNQGSERIKNRISTELDRIKMGAARDLTRIICGASTAPSGEPMGLNDLVSVTQSSSTNAGGVDPSSDTEWANQYKECTSVGGGGDLNRPLTFMRSLESLDLSVSQQVGSSNDRFLVGTQGAFMYYTRAAYADTTAQGNPNLGIKKFYDAGIEHAVFKNKPFIYDPEVTVPTGADSSTEAVYDIDPNAFKVIVKDTEFMKRQGPEPPRLHDTQRYYQMGTFLRYVPAVLQRNTLGVLYNIPANPDAS